MTDIAHAHPEECRLCYGLGYTNSTSSETKRDTTEGLRTIHRGSGCPRCGGTGRGTALPTGGWSAGRTDGSLNGIREAFDRTLEKYGDALANLAD